MKRWVLAPVLLISALMLTGCLFSVNHPRLAPDGTLAVFLEEDGGYTLFPETAVLHLLRDGAWIPLAGAALEGIGGLLDLSPDGLEALYVDTASEGFLEPEVSTLYRALLRPEADSQPICETEGAVVKAFWLDECILFLEFEQDEFGVLRELDPATGETTRLESGLLSFETLEASDELVLLAVEQGEAFSVASIIQWNRAIDTRETLASFVVSDETFELFGLLPHDFLWDVSPDGAWLALSLYDATLVDPAEGSETPDLYLIDTEERITQRIAENAVIPAFSPDGTTLVYAVEGADETSLLMKRDLSSGETAEISGTEGVSTVFWLSPIRLGMTFELDDDRYRLAEFDVITEDFRDLVAR